MSEAARVIVRGRVQGVGYRAWLAREAQALGLAGWARNRRDGTVEAQIEGESAAIERLIEACARGPALAAPSAVERASSAAESARGFEIRPTL